MKNITNFIFEKLKISSKGFDSSANVEIPQAFYNSIRCTPAVERSNYNKMVGYMKKGSKPSRLVHDITDPLKLMRRWIAAIELGWDAAAKEFKQAIVDRGMWDIEILDAYEDKLRKN